jgi:GNAT superfamily N-acetyltransferase
MSIYRKPPAIGFRSGLVGHVSNVYTRPEWRAKGLGTKLMQLLVDYARERDFDRLHLTATELGKGIYERVGFKPPRFPAFDLKF